MKHLQKFEGFLDKVSDILRSKSEKGKIVSEVLKKNNIPLEGYSYTLIFMGGVGLTPEVKSHPLSYLWNYEPNKGKAKFENGKLVISDDLKNKKVVNILPLLDVLKGIHEHGQIQSSAVIKFNYKFDLSKDVPTFEVKDASLFNIETGKFEPNDRISHINKVEELYDENNPAGESQAPRDLPFITGYDPKVSDLIINKDLTITYQNFVDECNKRPDVLEIIKNRFAPEGKIQSQVQKTIESFSSFSHNFPTRKR